MTLNFRNNKFLAAYGTSQQLPPSVAPEVSFAGRSNVGKSSLLNALMYRKDLAKVSATPGKTATVNFYDIDGASKGTLEHVAKQGAFFVDLPGYGYAKVAQKERGRWGELIENYFHDQRYYALVVCLVDIRLEAQSLDVQMINFLRENEFPFAIAFTKADKLSKQQAQKQVSTLKKQFGISGEVPCVVTSSQNGTGIDELRKVIAKAVEDC